MLMLNVVNGEKEEDDATRAPESGDKQQIGRAHV